MKQCRICGQWTHDDGKTLLGFNHKCPPKWLCYETLNYDPEDAEEIYAVDAELAAEKYFEDNDSDWEYPDEVEIMVCKSGTYDWQLFCVYAESCRKYRAKLNGR